MPKITARESPAKKTAYTALSLEDFARIDELARKNCRTISQELRLALIETGRLPSVA